MRSYVRLSFSAAILLVSVALCAQDIGPERSRTLPDPPEFLVRLSYDNSVFTQAEQFRHICVAVSRGGDYRIERSLDDGSMRRLAGKLTDQQLQELKKLLSDSDFRALSGSHSGLLRKTAENFAAEIFRNPRPDGTQRLQWLNADGEVPFPGPVARVVNWLKHLEPRDGIPFEYAEFPNVCPSMGLRLLQPLTAENSHP